MAHKNQNAVASIIGAVLFLLLYNFVDIFDLFDTKITYNANKSTSSYSSSSNSTQRETALQKATLDAKKEMFTISKTTVRRDGYFQYIEGTLKNNTGRRFSYVMVEYNLYDSEGYQIGTAFDGISNLDGNGTWRFSAIVTEEKATSYRLADITAF